LAAATPSILFLAQAYHTMSAMAVDYAPGRGACSFGKKSKKWYGEVVFQHFGLTGALCWARVWNQFQSLWSFLEASGVCDEKTV
jgi:hypothetical protein